MVVPRRKFDSTYQKHYPDLGSDASSVWNFCARFSDFIRRGNQWQRRQMSAVFSGYQIAKDGRNKDTFIFFLTNDYFFLLSSDEQRKLCSECRIPNVNPNVAVVVEEFNAKNGCVPPFCRDCTKTRDQNQLLNYSCN